MTGVTEKQAVCSVRRSHVTEWYVTTDASGNFVFTNPPTGSQVLLIDGGSPLYPASLPVQMTIQPGVANVLPHQVYLHEVSQTYFPITPGAQTVISPRRFRT